MSPLSKDPSKRERQLANLKLGSGKGSAPPGNQRRRLHGAYGTVAPDLLDAATRQIFDALAADAPVREHDGGLPAADVPAVRLLADTLCRLDSIGEYLARRGWEGEDGKPRPVLEYEASLTRVGHDARARDDASQSREARARLSTRPPDVRGRGRRCRRCVGQRRRERVRCCLVTSSRR